MGKPVHWSEVMDQTILTGRAAGRSWDRIAASLGLHRSTVIARGTEIGAKAPDRVEPINKDDDRRPLSAGSSASWSAINRGLSIEGVSFLPPEPVRRAAA